jgi:Zn-dependent protease with chaperone function
MLAKDLRTPRERTLFIMAAIFSSLVWLGMLISIVGILYGLLLAAIGLVIHCLFMAHVIGNGVRVGPRQLPELHRRIEAAAHKLGLDRVPEAYVLQAGGLLNAFATKILSRRFIIIYSDLLEACDDAGEAGAATGRANELDFVIAHELGHVAAGHLSKRLFLLPARILPLLGPAYSRACEYTCDRCGHAAVDDLTISSRALAILAAGPKAARRMDLDAFVEQRRDTGTFWMGVYELNASHPFLSKRVAALRQWQGQQTTEPVGRNPFSYLMAPFFSFASGGPSSATLIIVVFLGITAAMAVHRFKQGVAGAGHLPAMYDLEPTRGAADPLPPVEGEPK